MGRLSTADRQAREEYLIELIKTSGAEGVPSTVIADDCNISRSNVTRYMNGFLQEHPEIQERKGRNGIPTIYMWIEKPAPRETHSPFLKNRQEKAGKNHEGYSDPTATAAIKTTEAPIEMKGDMIMPGAGEVWVTEESNGRNGYIFVLAFEEGAAQCIRLYNMSEVEHPEDINRAIRVKIGAETFIGDASRVTFKPKRYLMRRALKRNDEILPGVRKAVASVLGILSFRSDVEPKVIEKEVIKEVPVEVEKIVYRDKESAPAPDGYISKTEAELRDYKLQAEIWKAAFYGVVNGNGKVAENL